MELIILMVICVGLGFLGIVHIIEAYYYWLLEDILWFDAVQKWQRKVNRRFAEIPDFW